jgi:hypothetical protein
VNLGQKKSPDVPGSLHTWVIFMLDTAIILPR